MKAFSPPKRVLLKLSGESLSGENHGGFDKHYLERIAQEIISVADAGIEIGIVIGAGNIFRGTSAKEFDLERVAADQIGMIATAINGIVLSQILEKKGKKTKVFSALKLDPIIESFECQRASQTLQDGVIAIFVGGTGNPYFTTDTAAALRASEMQAELLLKATKVGGVYDKDPVKHQDAQHFPFLSYTEVLAKDLRVIDASAVALCRDSGIEIFVFNFFAKDSLKNAIFHRQGGTLISKNG